MVLVSNSCAVTRSYIIGWAEKEERERREATTEQGHANSQFNLGIMYLEGRGGLRENTRKARTWFRKAAKQEHAGAKEVLEDL